MAQAGRQNPASFRVRWPVPGGTEGPVAETTMTKRTILALVLLISTSCGGGGGPSGDAAVDSSTPSDAGHDAGRDAGNVDAGRDAGADGVAGRDSPRSPAVGPSTRSGQNNVLRSSM